ncbi:hypothetical protein ACSHUI_00020 [Bacillus subtilis]|uniref:hypothetical protein n=1 Tax=Bacillus subtilis TaxID=1423 RepID=UPI0025C99140|nr:hypothetical protein [Bacillus subtilis]WCS68054.1 hypothetical protein Goe26_01420 [Bacillus phage vB_BsuM-Goe26]GLI90901.1 hypothetical protein ANABIO4_42530 [Bacillus subtilis]
MEKTLTWDSVLEQYQNLVKYAAKKTYNEVAANVGVDNSLGADDLYQVGLVNLYDCWVRYNHLSEEEFKAVFSKSLFRCVRKHCAASTAGDIESVEYMLEDTSQSSDIDALEEQRELYEEIEELKDLVENDLARAIISEIVAPSPRTLYTIWASKARKKCLKGQGYKVNVPKKNELTLTHIKTSLGVTSKQFDVALREIRRVAKLTMGDYLPC